MSKSDKTGKTGSFPQAANQTAGFAEHTRCEVAIIVDAVGFGGHGH
jgi:hypothetical protein